MSPRTKQKAVHEPCEAQLPGADPASARLLVTPGLRDPAAVRRRDGRGHLPSRDNLALAGTEAVAGRLCAAEPAADRRPLWRKPQPAAALLPVSGHHEAEPRGRAGAAAGQ